MLTWWYFNLNFCWTHVHIWCHCRSRSRIPHRKGHQPSRGYQHMNLADFPKNCLKLRKFSSGEEGKYTGGQPLDPPLHWYPSFGLLVTSPLGFEATVHNSHDVLVWSLKHTDSESVYASESDFGWSQKVFWDHTYVVDGLKRPTETIWTSIKSDFGWYQNVYQDHPTHTHSLGRPFETI